MDTNDLSIKQPKAEVPEISNLDKSKITMIDLTTKYKYIEFSKIDRDLWNIYNHKHKIRIATLEFNKKWKQWELCPYPMVAFTMDCLEDVIHFVEQLKKL